MTSIISNSSRADPAEVGFAKDVRTVIIIVGRKRTGAESKSAHLLLKRIQNRSHVDVSIVREGTNEGVTKAGIVFVMGTPESHDLLRSLGRSCNLDLPKLPDTDKLHPEGFAAKTTRIGRVPYVLISGVDERGLIYGIGAVLRSITFHPDAVDLPDIDLVEKPAFAYRGTVALSVGPNRLATESADLRPQTDEEVRAGIEDMMLLGANAFRGMEEFVTSHAMMTYYTCSINALLDRFPKEWKATPSNSLHIKVNEYFGTRFVCPSIPEARRALFEYYERLFKEHPRFDLFSIKSGDVAGCTCDKCMPWGGTFIKLVHEISEILHRYHPEAKLLATSQNLTNEGNKAILDYLNEHNTGWLYALHYAPGGNEMSTYNRAPINPRWFEYEGFGWSNYLKHLHHHLPTKTNVLLVSDVTHWIRSQYGVDHPDISLAVIYNRRAWNARPRHYHKVAREVFHYALGDLFYSEGMHDDFNKWFWYRMLWNPNLTPEEITREYCRYWFGPEAEEDMTEAIFLMEENLEKPVLGNPGIDKAVKLLRSARAKIPQNLMERDYRWHIMMQKALLDRYIQLWLERGEELKEEASVPLEEASKSENPRELIERALLILRKPQETEEMAKIMEEVRDLGEKSNKIIGYREPAFFNMREFDITEIGWWIDRLREALENGREEVMRNNAAMVLKYEDPGEGGYYERVGWPWPRIRLLEHQNIIGYFPFTGPARHHHYGMGYSWGRRDARMILRYDGLDPTDKYVLRVCVGFHCEFLREFLKGVLDGELVQSLEVNGVVIEPAVPLPFGDVELYEFDVPRDLTSNGKAEIVLRAGNDEFPVAGLSGIWLMKKDSMPWKLYPADQP